MTKVDVISGFLGAGKTTLISKLLKEVFQGQQIVLVENEFGEIGIDGGFLKDAGIEITEINSGCICCTLKGDFQASLKQVLDTYTPDRIVIEPSGVGKLSDILKAIRPIEGVDLDSYVTVVDAARCQIYHKNFKEFFDDQIATAACVILSRTQTVSEAKLQAAVDIIHELNPDARIITTPWDDLSGEAIFEAMTGSSDGFPEDLGPDEDEEEEEHGHHHDHDHDEDEEHEHHHHHDHDEDEEHEHHHHHDHDEDEEHEHHHHHDHDEDEELEHHHHHDHDEDEEHEHHHHHDNAAREAAANEGLSEGNRVHLGKEEEEHHHHHHHHHGEHDADEVFDSIGIETINKYTEEDLRTALAGLGENIVRAKGIVPDKNGSWIFFDYVPGDTDIRTGSPAYTGLITVIGEKVDIEEIKNLFGVK
ncbi:MAG: GTP-binding protein [Erysipelotrichaceae bacterium]|nr:GTP-binding protein [Erysipelotrichaceae bacterium]